MLKDEVVLILKNEFNFNSREINLLDIFVNILLKYNYNYNLIAQSTVKNLWERHILDSAQLIKYINFKSPGIINDLGSGAGFPGIVLSIYNKNVRFHVKLYEKSPVKCIFLNKVIKIANLNNVRVINNDVYNENIEKGYIVSRAFKKLDQIVRFSREKSPNGSKFIILKGQNAQSEADLAFKRTKIVYKLKQSITDSKSKIILFESRRD